MYTMRFSCEKYLLSMAVATAGRAAAVKSPIPALEGLLIDAGHNVRITGYDLKNGIYTTFDAEVDQVGSVVVSAKLFGDIVRKLPDGIVNIVVADNYMVKITCGNADFSIMGSDPGDYPEPPSMDFGTTLTLPQSNMYSTEGLEHVMCTLENDYCGQILKESYFAPKNTVANEQEEIKQDKYLTNK